MINKKVNRDNGYRFFKVAVSSASRLDQIKEHQASDHTIGDSAFTRSSVVMFKQKRAKTELPVELIHIPQPK